MSAPQGNSGADAGGCRRGIRGLVPVGRPQRPPPAVIPGKGAARSPPGRTAPRPLPASVPQPGRPGRPRLAAHYRFRCSLKSAVSARRASRSWMAAGIIMPDTRTGSGLGAAILPMPRRATTTRSSGRSGRGNEAAEGGAPFTVRTCHRLCALQPAAEQGESEGTR